MRISSGGNVGIGVTNIGAKLSVSNLSGTPLSTTALASALFAGNSGVGNGGSIGFDYDVAAGNHTNYPVGIGYIITNNTNFTKGALVFGTRDATTDTATTERMRIDSAGNVGIGTTSPAVNLQISGATSPRIVIDNSGSGAAKTAAIAFAKNGVQNWIIGSDNIVGNGTDIFSIYGGTSGSHKFVIDTSGNVGIGTTGPGAKLDVTGSNIGIAINGGVGYTNTSSLLFSSGRSSIVSQIAPSGAYGDTSLQFWTQTGGTVAERMRIDTNGNVGIGTTNPQAKLHVYNGLTTLENGGADATFGEVLRFARVGYPTSFYSSIWTNSASPLNSVNNNMQFRVSDGSGGQATVMTLQGTGNVGIGTTSPGYKLTVAGTAWVTSGSWSGSDQRWKKNIQPITNSLDKVLQLSGVSYDWRADEFPANNFDSKTHLGFIAQDVEKIVPDLVTTGDDGYKGIDYSGFSSLLVNAMKEIAFSTSQQQTQITGLATNLDTLNLKTDASVTTLSGLQTSVDANLLTISGTLATLDTRLSSIDDTKTGKLTTLDNRILSLEKTVGLSASALSHETRIADLESQMTTLKDENLALMDFFTTFKSGGIVTKDKDNNVDLLGGKLTATIVETGALVIDVIDPDAATAGVDSIMPVATDPGSDGKSVFIKTTAVTSDSRIYVTPIGSTKNQVPFIDSVKDGKGFTVSVDDPVLVDLRFNWLIVGKR